MSGKKEGSWAPACIWTMWGSVSSLPSLFPTFVAHLARPDIVTLRQVFFTLAVHKVWLLSFALFLAPTQDELDLHLEPSDPQTSSGPSFPGVVLFRFTLCLEVVGVRLACFQAILRSQELYELKAISVRSFVSRPRPTTGGRSSSFHAFHQLTP